MCALCTTTRAETNKRGCIYQMQIDTTRIHCRTHAGRKHAYLHDNVTFLSLASKQYYYTSKQQLFVWPSSTSSFFISQSSYLPNWHEGKMEFRKWLSNSCPRLEVCWHNWGKSVSRLQTKSILGSEIARICHPSAFCQGKHSTALPW